MDDPSVRPVDTGPHAELAQLFNHSLQMLCVAGTDGYFKRLNPAFERTLGYTQEELLSRPFLDLIHPEDRESTLAEVRKLAEGIPTIQFENRYRCKDGTYRWLSWTAAPVPASGLLYATALDVTESRRAGILFRQLLESTPDSMIIADGRGRITLVNRLAEHMFGYRREEMLGQEVEFLIPHRYRGRHREYIASYREAPRTRPMGTGIEIWALRKDGSEFPAEISLGPLETEEGLLILSAHRDITERKRLEQSLRERDAQLLAAQRIQERLLPEAAPVVRGFDIFGACYPAEFAAGDHFDYLTLWDDSLGIVVGDVVGHGMGPALVMTMTHAHLRSLAGIGAGIDEILLRANRMLVEETEPDIFVTMLFVRLDPHARSLTYASAGHPTAFILDGRGEVKAILPSLSLPLGIMPDTRFPVSDPIGVEAGDVILMFTDGLIEAASSAGVPFGESGMLEVLRRHSREPARKITEALYQTVLEYSGDRKLVDDVTLVVIKVEPPA